MIGCELQARIKGPLEPLWACAKMPLTANSFADAIKSDLEIDIVCEARRIKRCVCASKHVCMQIYNIEKHIEDMCVKRCIHFTPPASCVLNEDAG